MDILKDVAGVGHLISSGKASSNLAQRRIVTDSLWLIMERAAGFSLKEFVEREDRRALSLLEGIQLTIHLTGILEQMHSKGILHQNLSPEHIMINWDLKAPIEHAQLTVLNFCQADKLSNAKDRPTSSTAAKWYQTAQMGEQELLATIDSSGSCALLFWLLTKKEPQHESGKLPHQLRRDRIDEVICAAVKLSGAKEQLKLYLMDTFDRAFGYPHYQPWTVHDLRCRLRSIAQLLAPNEPAASGVDAIFQRLTSIRETATTSSTTVDDVYRAAFDRASQAICQAKKHFLESGHRQCDWVDGRCTWIYRPQRLIHECFHDDVLTYHSWQKGTTIAYPVIITCSAVCSEEGRVMTLFIGSNVNGKGLRIPIGQYSTAQDYSANVQQNFAIELKNLLVAIYNERQAIQDI